MNDLPISPDEFCLGVAGVIDHHLLLAETAVTATAEDCIIVQEDYGEQSGQDVRGPYVDEEGQHKHIFIIRIKAFPNDPSSKGDRRNKDVGVWPTSADTNFLICLPPDTINFWHSEKSYWKMFKHFLNSHFFKFLPDDNSRVSGWYAISFIELTENPTDVKIAKMSWGTNRSPIIVVAADKDR